MKSINRNETWWLFFGDILVLVIALWLSLWLRFSALPTKSVFVEHLVPFGLLFIIWLIVFFIFGLYEKHTAIFKGRLPLRIFNTQVFNSLLAVVFFYFIPYFGITPKTILFIYITISLLLIFLWRIYGSRVLNFKSQESAIILGQGEEMNQLFQEVNDNQRYGFRFVSAVDLAKSHTIDLQKNIIQKIRDEDVSVVVIDLQNEIMEKNLSQFYSLLFSSIRFVDINKLYEDIFDRIPVSLLKYNWFIENVSVSPSVAYDVFKRIADIIFSTVIGLLSLVLYPIVWLIIKLDDQGPLFIVQNRIGKNNKLIKIYKFRTMSFNDNEQVDKSQNNQITRVGKFLRPSRIDELPQMWNIFKGDLSLIGPRPELPTLTKIYEKEIPYYDVRHLIQPGLSGWAQLYHENHPHRGANAIETKNKLSYDLYYIKNRSVILDLKIALKTLKTLISQTGR